MDIEYRYCDAADIDWDGLKERLREDRFDNGRSGDALRRSFENSHSFCLALAEGNVIATARALSDQVCCAYLVDVWTYHPFRLMGIGTSTVETVLAGLSGQHVFLQTDDAAGFYRRLGFSVRPTGMERVGGSITARRKPEDPARKPSV